MTDLQSIVILAHPKRQGTEQVAKEIASHLEALSISTSIHTQWEVSSVQNDVQATDMVIAIGGDGAMLKAANVCAPHNVAVFGVNMGRLGFLTEVAANSDWTKIIQLIREDQYWIEERMMLQASIRRDSQTIIQGNALNDVVISGNAFGRMIQLNTYINGDWATSYNADALIIASPTGSTAYALALGGPILPPDLKNILIIPSAPHLSMDRPIVLSEGSKVEIRLSRGNRNPSVVSIDGKELSSLHTGDQIVVENSKYISRFIRIRGRNYFYRSLLDRLEPRVVRPQPEQ